MIDRKAWRALHVEEAIEPELEIVDTHHHLWDTPPNEWLEPYGAAAAIADKAGTGHLVTHTVMVDSHSNQLPDGPEHLRTVGETMVCEKVANEANAQGGRAAGLCAAIVSHVDLTLGSALAGEALDAHMAASPRFCGIRHMTANDPDVPHIATAPPGTMLSAPFLDGFGELRKRGLSFDSFFYQGQMDEVVQLADRFPDTVIVLDHLASPMGIGRYANDPEGAFAEWRAGIARLAERPNTVMKLSGLNMMYTGMSADGEAEPPSSALIVERQKRHVLTAIELYGPKRCMFASNFPVEMLNISYSVLWNGFKLMTRDFSADERADLFSETGKRVYKIR